MSTTTATAIATIQRAATDMTAPLSPGEREKMMTKRKRMLVDQGSYDLAERFLADEPWATKDHIQALAEDIQSAIESYLEYERPRK